MDPNDQSQPQPQQDPSQAPDDQAAPAADNGMGQTDQQVTEPSSLPEDNSTSAQPADDSGSLPVDHPANDDQSNSDSTEAQDAGNEAASGVDMPTDTSTDGLTPPAQTEGEDTQGADDSQVS